MKKQIMNTQEENYNLICQEMKKITDALSNENIVLSEEQITFIDKQYQKLSLELEKCVKRFKKS